MLMVIGADRSLTAQRRLACDGQRQGDQVFRRGTMSYKIVAFKVIARR
jgi:hypothetical protein